MKRDDSYLIGNQHAAGSEPNRTAFKKGSVPWNKGKKGMHLSPASEFKKGRKSERAVQLGTITIRRHKGDGDRNWIKTEGGWMELSKHVWREHHGEVFIGDIVHHINGDRLDDTITNLIAVPRADHPVFHNRWGLKMLTRKQLEHYFGRYDDEIAAKRLAQEVLDFS